MFHSFYPSYRAFALVLTIALLCVSCKPESKTNWDVIPEETGEEFGIIGTVAPPLDIEHWIQDGEGKFDHITKFKKGKVYIVEFWATWCGPCVQAMPHIVELQEKYAEKGVQVVSVSNESRAEIDEFLKKTVSGQKRTTYKELTKSYCLTCDPDGSVYKDYMDAAGQEGIPTAFIVGKTGRIEWIGHPLAIEEPLNKIVENGWDRAEFGAPFKAQHESQQLMTELNTLLKNGESEKAIRMIEEAIAKTDAGTEHDKLTNMKWQILMFSGKAEGLTELTSEVLEKATTAVQINDIAWLAFQIHMQNSKIEADVLKICADAAETAANDVIGPQKSQFLFTVAHLRHELGDLDAAIAAQTKSVELFQGPQKVQLQKFLDQLIAEKDSVEKGGDKEGDDESSAEDTDAKEGGADEGGADESGDKESGDKESGDKESGDKESDAEEGGDKETDAEDGDDEKETGKATLDNPLRKEETAP